MTLLHKLCGCCPGIGKDWQWKSCHILREHLDWGRTRRSTSRPQQGKEFSALPWSTCLEALQYHITCRPWSSAGGGSKHYAKALALSFLYVSAMDILEEFLELGRFVTWFREQVAFESCSAIVRMKPQVSVTTMMQLFSIIKRRFPRRLLPCLVHAVLCCTCSQGPIYGVSSLWRSVAVAMGHGISGPGWQGSRGVLCCLKRSSCLTLLLALLLLLRVPVVLQDMAKEERHYIGNWHMLLPSETTLG